MNGLYLPLALFSISLRSKPNTTSSIQMDAKGLLSLLLLKLLFVSMITVINRMQNEVNSMNVLEHKKATSVLK